MTQYPVSGRIGGSVVLFRPLEQGDAERLLSVYPDAPYGEQVGEKADDWLSEQAKGARLTLVAVVGGQLAACGSVGLSGEVAWIQDVAVRADFRNKGAATLLVRLLVAEAQRRGARRVCVHVRADNPSARRVYEKAGLSHAGADGMRGEQLRYAADLRAGLET